MKQVIARVLLEEIDKGCTEGRVVSPSELVQQYTLNLCGSVWITIPPKLTENIGSCAYLLHACAEMH
jgi:ribosomal protein S25